jgi:hypothetical protein
MVKINNGDINMRDSDSISIGTILKIVIIIVVLISFGWLTGQYKIEKGEGVILTKLNGDKVAITTPGWYWHIIGLESYDKYSIVNNALYFPEDLVQLEQKFQGDKQTGSIGYDIKTSDNKVVDTGGMVQFVVVDLVQFGVMNTRPMEQLQKTVNGEFFKILQSRDQTSDIIINDQGISEDKILNGLKTSGIQEQYGVKFTRVQLIRPTFTKDALDALATKQATISLSEGESAAAEKKANATRTIADAENYKANLLKNYPSWVLNYNSQIELWKVLGDKERKDATVYVIQPGVGGDGNSPSVVLPSPKNQ